MRVCSWGLQKKKAMSTLDNIVASVQDSILPGLNYNLSSRKGGFVRPCPNALHLLSDD